MKKTFVLLITLLVIYSCKTNTSKSLPYGEEISLSTTQLMDKIKGGWAGQTIGCTYGGPTEFKYRGALIHDNTPIIWYDDYAKETFDTDPGLYDDVYMDLTFVEIFNRCGLDAPADSFALAFANAPYKLWHANQAARYNILNGVMPPASGNWINNPHADDIDFQIEADFAGMMTPGMVNTGITLCDKVGHIMNSGDGYYGGVFMSAMYSLAFVSNDIPLIVKEGLKTIPPTSNFRKCIEEVITLYEKDHSDWKNCWMQIEQHHGYDIGCPEGVFNAFNIDAAINAAYVVIGLLYGEGDFYKTMDISTRCGQDSDCNPASAVGILGVIIGYEKISSYWKPAIEKVEMLDFPYTKISLKRIYEINYNLATQLIKRNEGTIHADSVTIKLQQPIEVPWEKNFTNHYPIERRMINKDINNNLLSINITGNGIAIMGMVKQHQADDKNYIARLQASIDGTIVEVFNMPFDYIKRKYDIFHRYQLSQGEHSVEIKWLNPNPNYSIFTKDIIVYGDTPLVVMRPDK